MKEKISSKKKKLTMNWNSEKKIYDHHPLCDDDDDGDESKQNKKKRQ